VLTQTVAGNRGWVGTRADRALSDGEAHRGVLFGVALLSPSRTSNLTIALRAGCSSRYIPLLKQARSWVTQAGLPSGRPEIGAWWLLEQWRGIEDESVPGLTGRFRIEGGMWCSVWRGTALPQQGP
jgi:hypothetical protein